GASLEEDFADLDFYVQEALFGDDDTAQQKKGFGFKGGKGGEPRVFSPDKKLHAYAQGHNLYLAEDGKETEAVQLTKDGVEQYTFNAGGGFGFGGLLNYGQQDQEKEKAKDKKVRPNLTWSKDSKVF